MKQVYPLRNVKQTPVKPMREMNRILTRGRLRRRLRAAPDFARAVRERAGLTQSEMAALFGVSQMTVSRWERGSAVPSARALGRLADLLDRLEADI